MTTGIMAVTNPDAPPTRLVLALDATLACGEALEAAADLAQLMQAELHALFLQDQDLLALAEMPCSLEICLQPAGSRSLQRSDPRQLLQRALELAEQDFDDLLLRKQLRGSFRSLQGPRRELLDDPRERGDLLWFNYRSPLTRYPTALPAWRDTLYVLATPTAAGEHALQLGLYLRGQGFQRLCILHGRQAPALLATVAHRHDTDIRQLPEAALQDAAQLLARIENRRTHTLLLPDDAPLARDRERLLAVLGPLRTEVLLVH